MQAIEFQQIPSFLAHFKTEEEFFLPPNTSLRIRVPDCYLDHFPRDDDLLSQLNKIGVIGGKTFELIGEDYSHSREGDDLWIVAKKTVVLRALPGDLEVELKLLFFAMLASGVESLTLKPGQSLSFSCRSDLPSVPGFRVSIKAQNLLKTKTSMGWKIVSDTGLTLFLRPAYTFPFLLDFAERLYCKPMEVERLKIRDPLLLHELLPENIEGWEVLKRALARYGWQLSTLDGSSPRARVDIASGEALFQFAGGAVLTCQYIGRSTRRTVALTKRKREG